MMVLCIMNVGYNGYGLMYLDGHMCTGSDDNALNNYDAYYLLCE